MRGDQEAGYDIDISDFFFDIKNAATTQRVYHLFKFSDFMLNMAGVKYNRTELSVTYPNMIFVHQGDNV